MNALQAINKHIEIKAVTDDAFCRYGRVLGIDAAEMLDSLDGGFIQEGYCLSYEALEKTALFSYLGSSFYGGMPIQAGICAGRNTKLNCFEYHRGTEINIAATNLVLLLAYTDDIHDNHIDSSAAEAFYVPKGCVVALYETTLHFSPLSVYSSGFVCIVVLPQGTNGEPGDFEIRTPEDALLFKTNKWLLGHEESRQVQNNHAFCGVTGENISITPMEGHQ